jgi:hypothetical protein
VTALELRSYLASLHAERALALAGDPLPVAELDVEIELARTMYAGAVVTEIATLRGQLFGRQTG